VQMQIALMIASEGASYGLTQEDEKIFRGVM
jgi:hypothetical protein